MRKWQPILNEFIPRLRNTANHVLATSSHISLSKEEADRRSMLTQQPQIADAIYRVRLQHVHIVAQAFKRLARVLHPDKGGRGEAFARLQLAFAVLSDPKQRKVYDQVGQAVMTCCIQHGPQLWRCRIAQPPLHVLFI